MNPEQLRREVFELMLESDRCGEPSRYVRLQFEIENKIDGLVSLTGLPRRSVELLLSEQYTHWLAEFGHGTDEAGAEFR